MWAWPSGKKSGLEVSIWRLSAQSWQLRSWELSPREGMRALRRRERWELALFSTWKCKEMTTVCKPGWELSLHTRPASALILDFPAARTTRKKCLFWVFFKTIGQNNLTQGLIIVWNRARILKQIDIWRVSEKLREEIEKYIVIPLL